MSSQWYYCRSDQRYGPFTGDQLKRFAASGQLVSSDLVWKEGMAEWLPATKLEGLFPTPPQPTVRSVASLPVASAPQNDSFIAPVSPTAQPQHVARPGGKFPLGFVIGAFAVLAVIVAGFFGYQRFVGKHKTELAKNDQPAAIQARPSDTSQEQTTIPAVVSPPTMTPASQIKQDSSASHKPTPAVPTANDINTLRTASVQANPGQQSLPKPNPSQTPSIDSLRKAAEQGDATAQSNLGDCYYSGDGVGQDQHEAAKWFRKAADQGHAAAQSRLGFCYYNGDGVGQDQHEAAKWFRKAAGQGYADAQANLGHCYRNGMGVEKDEREAIKWYRKAADQGHAGAKQALQQLGQQ